MSGRSSRKDGVKSKTLFAPSSFLFSEPAPFRRAGRPKRHSRPPFHLRQLRPAGRGIEAPPGLPLRRKAPPADFCRATRPGIAGLPRPFVNPAPHIKESAGSVLRQFRPYFGEPAGSAAACHSPKISFVCAMFSRTGTPNGQRVSQPPQPVHSPALWGRTA